MLLPCQVMYYGMGPVFILGAVLGYCRLWYMWTVALKFRDWQPGMKYKSIYKFESDLDVEVASRVMRVWDEDDTYDAVAIDLAETIIKARFGGHTCRLLFVRLLFVVGSYLCASHSRSDCNQVVEV